jgi:hypothetical protein
MSAPFAQSPLITGNRQFWDSFKYNKVKLKRQIKKQLFNWEKTARPFNPTGLKTQKTTCGLYMQSGRKCFTLLL